MSNTIDSTLFEKLLVIRNNTSGRNHAVHVAARVAAGDECGLTTYINACPKRQRPMLLSILQGSRQFALEICAPYLTQFPSEAEKFRAGELEDYRQYLLTLPVSDVEQRIQST